jgi:hypothetical protein
MAAEPLQDRLRGELPAHRSAERAAGAGGEADAMKALDRR